MADRFFIATPPDAGRATLDGPEAHHLLHVMRARVGDAVVLFDGHGGEYPATIEQCGRSEVMLAVDACDQVSRELPVRITMGVALPKGDRQKWLVEKLTELGVARLTPLSTERSVAELKGKSLERLERGVIEACKQCGRNLLMDITPPQDFETYVAEASGLRLIAHPTGAAIGTALDAATAEVTVIVGPEGGLTDAEVDHAEAAGWRSVSLGASILRIETAAMALAAVIAAQGR